MSTPVATFPVSVTRRRKSGQVVPFTIMKLTRVPSVGECIGYVAGGRTDAHDEPVYVVTAVVHFPLDHRPADNGGVAEVWAVEHENAWGPGFIASDKG